MKKKNATIKNNMKTMNILRMTLVFALLWCAGLQNAKAGSLLSKEDSLALVKMVGEYQKARENAGEKRLLKTNQLDASDSLYDKKKEEIDKLYEEEIEGLEKGFGNSLAANPRFATVVSLRNLLMKHRAERDAAEVEMEKERKNYYDKVEEPEPLIDEFIWNFIPEWDEKFIQLIKENPLFIEYPEYLFHEIYEGMQVATSADGRLRYYCWYNWLGGSDSELVSLRQYRTDDGKVMVSNDQSESEYEPDMRYVEKIHTLDAKGKRIYLLEEFDTSGGWASYAFHTEAINGQDITHPHVFGASDKKSENFEVEYYRFDSPNTYEEKEDWVVKFDEAKSTFFVRTYKNEGLKILGDDYKSYTFNGENFVESLYEDIDYSIKKIVSYVEEEVFFGDPKTLLDEPLKILTEYFNDKEYSLSDKTLMEDMKRRIERKEPIAHILYLGAAEKGDAVAQYKLGKCYYNGYLGVKRNTKEAKKWFEMAANQGHWLSQQFLGNYYNDPKYDKSSSWYAKDSAKRYVSDEELKEFAASRVKAIEAWETVQELTSEEDLDLSGFSIKGVWEKKFAHFILDHPATLDYPNKEMEQLLGKDFTIVTSPDGMLRTYCWYVFSGGSTANRCNVTQYRTANGKTYVTWDYDNVEVKVSEGNEADANGVDDQKEEEYVSEFEKYVNEGGWNEGTTTEKIVQMDTGNGRIYILQDYFSVNGIYGVKYLKACVITDGSVFLIPIFIKDNKKTSEVSFEGQNAWLLDEDFITFDEANKTITIKQYDEEEIDENGNYKRLNDIVYKFDGQFFRQVK